MKKGYWIVKGDVTDWDKFKQYGAKTPAIIEKFCGKFLVRAGQSTLVEGSSRERNTVIEFSDYETALACWNSEEYQAVKQIRESAGELDIVVIEGA